MLNTIWAWVHANLGAIFFLWAFGGALLSCIGKNTNVKARWPALARTANALSGFLFDVLKVCEQFRGNEQAPPPPPPPPANTRKPPPDEPLPPTLRRSAELAFFLRIFGLPVVFLGVLLVLANACGAGAADTGAEAAYTSQLVACVKAAKTRAEANACHDRVQADWGVADAGGQ